jgi:polygalacturonase
MMSTIQTYGAVSDGKTNNAVAIQRAIDDCHQAGGGRVEVPAGTWMTGGIELKSGVELHLARGCRLVGSPSLADYPFRQADGYHAEKAPEKSSHSLIWAERAENIALSGDGVIEGSGISFYEEGDVPGKKEKPSTPRPRIVMFFRCRNIDIKDLTFRDCACWTIWLMQSELVRVEGIRIEADYRLRNVDGIDIDSCRDVLVQNCNIDTEDDCIAIRAMQRLYDEPSICENIKIAHCIFRSHCQGVRIGCPNDATIRRVQISDLIIDSEWNGIVSDHPHRYFKSDVASRLVIEDISISHCRIFAKEHPLLWQVPEGVDIQSCSDIRFAHLQISGGNACRFQGNSQNILKNLHFANIRIDSLSAEKIQFKDTSGVTMQDVTW